MGQAHTVEHRAGKLPAAPELLATRVPEGHLDVLERRAPGKQVELLKDEADVAPPHPVEAPTPDAGDRRASKLCGSRGRQIEEAQDVQQRGLARAAAADDRDVVSCRHRKVDTAQDVERRLVGERDLFGHTLEPDKAHQLHPGSSQN